VLEGYRKGINMEDPSPLGKYLGCDHIEGSITVKICKTSHPEPAPRKTNNPASKGYEGTERTLRSER
jgi:hypothetical protein